MNAKKKFKEKTYWKRRRDDEKEDVNDEIILQDDEDDDNIDLDNGDEVDLARWWIWLELKYYFGLYIMYYHFWVNLTNLNVDVIKNI